MGQRIRTLGERDQASPVKVMVDIKKSREASLERVTKKSTTELRKQAVGEIKESIKKSASKRPTWEEFIKQITCGY